MAEFRGFNNHNIDDKGRLVLPKSFHDAFEDGGVMVCMGPRVVLLLPSAWESRLRKLTASGDFTTRELAYVKSFVEDFTPDVQHRVKIPDRLRERAGLQREVAVIGMGDHIDVYDSEVWREHEVEAVRENLDERLVEAW